MKKPFGTASGFVTQFWQSLADISSTKKQSRLIRSDRMCYYSGKLHIGRYVINNCSESIEYAC